MTTSVSHKTEHLTVLKAQKSRNEAFKGLALALEHCRLNERRLPLCIDTFVVIALRPILSPSLVPRPLPANANTSKIV